MKSVTIKNHQESLKEPSVVWEKYTRDVKNNPNRYFVYMKEKIGNIMIVEYNSLLKILTRMKLAARVRYWN